MKKITFAAIAVLGLSSLVLTGCGTAPRLVDAEARGMYVNAATETLAIGSGSITTIPSDREAFLGNFYYTNMVEITTHFPYADRGKLKWEEVKEDE